MSELKGLVLAGGSSSRMGQDKGSLEFRGERLRDRAARILATVCDEVYVSLRRDQISDQFTKDQTRLLTDSKTDIGPAAGMLEAYARDPNCAWFVLACDFPMADELSVQNLAELSRGDADVSCYANANGRPEPLFAIWQPTALRRLQGNVASGKTGPIATLFEMKNRLITPNNLEWLTNTNDAEHFNAVISRNL